PWTLKNMVVREKRISDGLAAAEKGQKDLAEASSRAEALMKDAREKALQVEENARRRANEMIEQAKAAAVAEGERLIAAAKAQIAQESNSAREDLRRQVGALAVSGAGMILEREVDARTHADVLDKLASRI
ncbi:MAG: F0F1 ATP synthase subunit B, partial [Steroidobacterales bacterium]